MDKLGVLETDKLGVLEGVLDGVGGTIELDGVDDIDVHAVIAVATPLLLTAIAQVSVFLTT